MKLAMYQMENAESIQKNLTKSLAAINTAAEHGADLILFPEVQLTEFFHSIRAEMYHLMECPLSLML